MGAAEDGPVAPLEPAVRPVRRRVVVSADAPTAWTALTEGTASWWPLGVLSVTADPAATLRFVGDRLVETGPDGANHPWGRVTRWEPPLGLVMTWHPGTDPAEATEVEWRLTPLGGDSTLVEVVHRGWDRWDDGADAAQEYDQGWPVVLGALADEVDADEPPAVWHVLTYAPGPAAEPGGIPWEQDWFAGHAAFLDGLKADGALVAAGLLPASDRGLRTVVRGLATEEVVRRATEDDPTVSAQYLQVSVAPWLIVSRGQVA